MNEKLNAWDGRASDYNSNTGRRGSVRSNALVALSVNEEEQPGGGRPKQVLRISLHERILKLTGWQAGDLLDCEFRKGIAYLFRSDKGRTLSLPPHSTRCVLRYAYPAGTLNNFPEGEGQNVETQPGVVAFKLPDSNNQ